jgi:hypothetical protein
MTLFIRSNRQNEDRPCSVNALPHCPVKASCLILSGALLFTCCASVIALAVDSAKKANGPTAFHDVRNYPGVDFGAKLAACITDLPATGGICDARDVTDNLALSSDLIISKRYTTIYLPYGNIQMGVHSIVVRAKTHGVSLMATAMHGNPTTQGPMRLSYSGVGCAIQVGDPTENTVGFRADNLFVDLTPASTTAQGLCLTRTQNISIQRPTIIGIQSTANTQVLIKLNGSGNYTGGLIQQPFLSNGNVHIWFTQGANAVTVLHAQSAGNGGYSIAVKLDNGGGNTFLGGDYENFGTAFYLGGGAVNNSFYGVRVENNKQDFVAASRSSHNMAQTTGALKYIDNGTQNTFLLGRYTSTGHLTFQTLGTSQCADNTLKLNGAVPGDTVALGTPPPPPNGFFSAFISGPNTVTIRYCSLQSNGVADGTFRVEVAKH